MKYQLHVRILLMTEQSEIPILIDPIKHLESLLARGDSRFLIGLAGLPGSGKSTFAAKLADEMNAIHGHGTMVALGMDGFHLTKAQLRKFPDPDAALARRGAPWTFDPAGFAARLQLIKESFGTKSVIWPEFQHGVGDPVADGHTVDPDVRIVLVEGLYLLSSDGDWAQVSQLFDEKWFLDTPMELSLERLAERHVRTRGVTREEADRRIAVNDRLNAELTLATRRFSDWRVQ
jgi:pantothenate kinase